MVLSIDIGRIKRESYRIIRQDGLSDICGGLMLAIMALFFIDFKYAGALIVGCSMQTIVLPTCRRKITFPRVGYAKFPGRIDKKNLIMWDIALPLAVVTLVICVSIWLRPLLPLTLGIILAGLAFPSARATQYVLDYVLTAAFLASGVIGQMFVWFGRTPQTATALQFWGLSGILIPVGAVLLARFLRDNPLPTKDV